LVLKVLGQDVNNRWRKWLSSDADCKKIVLEGGVAKWLEIWTNNPKVVGSMPSWALKRK